MNILITINIDGHLERFCPLQPNYSLSIKYSWNENAIYMLPKPYASLLAGSGSGRRIHFPFGFVNLRRIGFPQRLAGLFEERLVVDNFNVAVHGWLLLKLDGPEKATASVANTIDQLLTDELLVPFGRRPVFVL